uniref:Extracellular solute-binding protein family 1 n=1 Tax=uncultured bacterium Contig16 TaxID=1393468 RepID=W0FMI4_9BACT|nr:extracellular solute-binding protein family 1 [uncultured bacterium Contig16]
MKKDKRSPILKPPLLSAALFVMLLLTFTSCRNTGQEKEGAETEVPSYDRIVMTFIVDERQTIRDELPAVSEELNRITREEIGAEVELLPLTEKEITSRFPLWMSDQEAIDLVFIDNNEIGQYFSQRMLLSLDEYIYSPEIDTEALTNHREDLTKGAVYHGFTYGISNVDDSNIYGRCFVVSEEALRRAGIVTDPAKVYAMEEAGEIFRTLKAENEGVYPACSMISEDGSLTENYVSPFYTSSSKERIGVDYDMKSGQFFSRYASSYYLDFIEMQRSWYLEGLLYPDLLLSDYTPKELARAGIVLAYASDNSPEHLSDSGFSDGAVIMNMTKSYRETEYVGSGYWTIPKTAENPEAAVRLLNLMYRDTRITNLLTYGIEGVHYTVTDAGKGLIKGERKADGTYLYDNPYPVYGSLEQAYKRMAPEVFEAYLSWKEAAQPVTDPAEGLSWPADDYIEEIQAVQEAVRLYAPLLESGSADLDVYYPRFLKALSDAGIDALIAALKQAAK